MEGCPRLPTISFDSKICVESVNLCEKIPQFISSHYHESGDKYANECEQMNRLRQNAINASMDEAGLAAMRRYYCQLLLLENRFPMLPETECAVRFTWEDAFQKEDSTFNDIRFEEASILYNIGALQSRLGTNENRKTPDSIKAACTYFRCAAACFEKVRDQYMTYSADLTPDLLSCQVQILLAQAHEAILEKSLLDQRPALVNAPIAMQISEYYQMAHLNLMKPGINSIVSKRFREWNVLMTYKFSYYFALTHFYSGVIAESDKKYGQMVCYYESAVEKLKEAWKSAEKISSDKAAPLKDAHLFTFDVLMGKFKSAKRDNDSVYFERVPILSSLTAVQGVILAKSQPFDCHNAEICGSDIFQKIIPMDAHLAASEYSEEKAKLLRDIVELTETKNRELDTFMNCLQLERFPRNADYRKLPRELMQCCANATANPNMIKDLVNSMQQLNSQHHAVSEQVNDLQQELKLFEDTDPANNDVKELKLKLQNIHQIVTEANESNVNLHQRMTKVMEHLKILSSPLNELEKSLPAIAEIEDENNRPKLELVSKLYEKIETMKNDRDLLINNFRRQIQDDDITKLVIMQRQNNHQNLFVEQLKKHQELVSIIKQNCTAQEKIIRALTEANAEVAELRVKIMNTFEARNRLIQDYMNAFTSFTEAIHKAGEGIEFYKKQTVKLTKIRESLNLLQAKRIVPHRLPKMQNETRQSLPATSLREPPDLNMTMPDRPRLKDYLATMKPDSWGGGNNPTSRAGKRTLAKFEESTVPPSHYNNPMVSQPVVPRPSSYETSMHLHPQTFQVPFYQPHSQPGYPSFPAVHTPYPFSHHPQPVYQPPPPPQPVYQPPPPQPVYQPQPTSTTSRSNPPPKFDPYRPQPLGAYEIPKQQDIYRPNTALLMPSNHNSIRPPTPTIIATTNIMQPVPKPSPTISIVDDLLSLALEQQAEPTLPPIEPAPLLNPPEEDLQVKSITKPIACIQPLSMLVEEKKVVSSATTIDLQDPYENRDKLDQLLGDVQRFEKHVSSMMQKTLNGTIPLEIEWKELADFQEREVHSQTSAIGKCNPKLNRFQDLIPYDNSRICLSQGNVNPPSKNFNDYINATNIGRIRDPALLIGQYPLPTTIHDFWSMIYDQHASIVVILLRTDEIMMNVCPGKIGEELKYSFFTITLMNSKISNPLTNHKILRLHNAQTNQTRSIIWLEHLGWPPKEMPENPAEFLKFIVEVEHFLVQTRNRRSTILVSCLSGVARTGPFLTLFTAIQDINEGRPFPDLNKIIRTLRMKRRHLIQDMNQLKFVYEALLHYARDFLVKRGALKLEFNCTPTSTSNTITQLNEELQTIIDRAKPTMAPTPNYDIGPVLSSPTTVKELSPIEQNFNLRPEESHIRPKTTREDFFRTKPTPVKDLSDPFNQLDPLWSLRS